jgi:eukaryotic-like serine/threonine-protein kinase
MTKQPTTDHRAGAALWVDGRYRLDERLDADELVEIWRAHDELLHRAVTLKRLHEELLAERGVLDEFRGEAMAVAGISHTNVARRYEVEIRDDVAYTTSEHIEGPSLAELCARRPLEVDAVAAAGFHAASGLAAAHERGVVHRAISPRTLLIGTDGRLRLAYFRMLSQPGVGTGPAAEVDGQRHYLAPEQLRGEPATTASDVYALGRTLQAAWVGSPHASMDTATDGPLARTLKTLPGVFRDDRDQRLREIILAMVDPQPASRPTAAEVRDLLTGICGSRGELVLRPLVADA